MSAAVAMVAVGTTACTSGSGSPGSATSPDLGRVPIPTAPANATATAGPNHPALLAMGVPLHVALAGLAATVVATGPAQSTEYNGGTHQPTRTGGTFSVAVTVTSGALTLHAADFSSRDETGTAVDLRPVGSTSIRVTPARSRTIRLSGTYGSGAAQLTWRNAGQVVAIWDFNIELD